MKKALTTIKGVAVLLLLAVQGHAASTNDWMIRTGGTGDEGDRLDPNIRFWTNGASIVLINTSSTNFQAGSFTKASTNTQSYIVMSLSRAGQVQWVNRYDQALGRRPLHIWATTNGVVVCGGVAWRDTNAASATGDFITVLDAATGTERSRLLPTLASGGESRVADIKPAPDGNLIVAGYHLGGSFSYKTVTSTSRAAEFLMKIDTSGNVVWSKTFPHATNSINGDISRISTISVAPDGGIWGYGYNWGPWVTYDTLSVTNDDYIVRFSSAGAALEISPYSADFFLHDIAHDSTGALYVCGKFAPPYDSTTYGVTFGGKTFVNSAGAYYNLFVARMTNTSKASWVIQGARTGTADESEANSIAIAGTNIWVAGDYGDMDYVLGTNHLANGGMYHNAFLASLSTNGTWLKAYNFQGPNDDEGGAAAVDHLGNVSAGLIFASPVLQMGTLSVTNVGGPSSYEAPPACAYDVAIYHWLGTNQITQPTGNAPQITLQPTNIMVGVGSNALFTAQASGTAPLVYQWYAGSTRMTNGTRIAGATTNTLSITGVLTNDSGGYKLVVTNAYGAVTSSVASLTVLRPPAISAQPTNITAVAGTYRTNGVTATGDTLSYAWLKGGVVVSGATNSFITWRPVAGTDAGSYTVRVFNPVGAVTSQVATLTVMFPPSITLQPTNCVYAAGAAASLVSGTTGTATLYYQWYFNGAKLTNSSRITGATTASLGITALVAADAGNYWMVVTNAYGTATSQTAVVTVVTAPSITQQPTNSTTPIGGVGNFYVTAVGSAPLNYQWFRGSVPLTNQTGHIVGAQTSALQLQSVTTNDLGGYKVTVSNSAGSVTSIVATLSAPQQPVFVIQPTNVTVGVGGIASFITSVSGTPTLAYQWFFGTNALTNSPRITGASTNTLSISALTTNDAGTYRLVVTNTYGSATSQVAVLTVPQTPLITQQPANATVISGYGTNFSVTASGSAPLYYQWYRNGAPITDQANYYAGTKTSKLTVYPLVPSLDGDYFVVITNSVGSVTSSVATLTTVWPATVVTQPTNTSTRLGGSATLTGVASGKPKPVYYQWIHSGTGRSVIDDPGHISGSQSSTLVFSNSTLADSDVYRVAVSNSVGTSLSYLARLTVKPPAQLHISLSTTNANYMNLWVDGNAWGTVESSTNLIDWVYEQDMTQSIVVPKREGSLFYRLQ